MPDHHVPVLDHGYVRLIEHLGDDLRVINAARASFAKESAEFGDRDRKLLAYLWRNQELSVFRHCAATFEVKAPLFICRQWWKYHVASNHTTDQDGWNEQSKRYVTAEPEFHLPATWRSAPENAKQGSGGAVSKVLDGYLDEEMRRTAKTALHNYQWALDNGVAPEQARLFLPANAQYTTWYWTTSLAGLLHFLRERLGAGAQHEITQYAMVVRDLAAPLWPEVFTVAELHA